MTVGPAAVRGPTIRRAGRLAFQAVGSLPYTDVRAPRRGRRADEGELVPPLRGSRHERRAPSLRTRSMWAAQPPRRSRQQGMPFPPGQRTSLRRRLPIARPTGAVCDALCRTDFRVQQRPGRQGGKRSHDRALEIDHVVVRGGLRIGRPKRTAEVLAMVESQYHECPARGRTSGDAAGCADQTAHWVVVREPRPGGSRAARDRSTGASTC